MQKHAQPHRHILEQKEVRFKRGHAEDSSYISQEKAKLTDGPRSQNSDSLMWEWF